ncbi:MAG TPA: ATP-grasp domain-containing protein [Candidatus Nitrosocosmicus sp.]
MKKINVLVTSVGGIVAHGIIKSLNFLNKFSKNKTYYYNILGTDIVYDSSGLYRVDKFAIINSPKNEIEFVESIINLCIKNDIDIIIVGSDIELDAFCKNKDIIERKTSAKVVTNTSDVISICRNKYKTFEFLKEHKLNYIPSCLKKDVESFLIKNTYPLVVKPCEGFGSKFFSIVKNIAELNHAVMLIENYGWTPLIQKYLKNDDNEFTTGITLDKNGNHIMSSISMKKILKHGQTYKALIDNFSEIRTISEITAKKIGGIGAINIQLRIDDDDGQAKIIEINPRFSASCPMRTVAGINEPDIVIRNTLFDEEIRIMEYQSLLCLRYWNESYIELEKFNNIKSSHDEIKKGKSFVIDYF